MPIAGAIIGLVGSTIVGASSARSARRRRRAQSNQNSSQQFLDIMRQLNVQQNIGRINTQFDFSDEGAGTPLREQLEGLQQNTAQIAGDTARNRLLSNAGLERFRLARAGINSGGTNNLARDRLRQDLAVARTQALGEGRSVRGRAENSLQNLRQGLTTRAQGGLFSSPSDISLQQQGIFGAARGEVAGQAIGSSLSDIASTIASSGDARELGRLGIKGLFSGSTASSGAIT